MSNRFSVVTGAFGYSGKYIASRLLANGERVRTLTSATPEVDPHAGRVEVRPLAFDDPAALRASLEGAGVLYNTYWVRFNHRSFSHARAVDNTRRLFEAAVRAGVERIVHTSITNPSLSSPFEYFRGKAELEKALRELGVSYAILRPAVVFGPEDILINNIAWALRRLPVFGVFGDGKYRLQPIFVEDFADLAVRMGSSRDDTTIDAIGPETFTYRELVAVIGRAIGVERPIVGVPPWLGYLAGWIVGKLERDVLVTWEEVRGLMADLLVTASPSAGRTRLSDWLAANAARVGAVYHNELARRITTSAARAHRRSRG